MAFGRASFIPAPRRWPSVYQTSTACLRYQKKQAEALTVGQLPIVEAEGLFVQIAEQIGQLHGNVRCINSAFEWAPKVFQTVLMHVSIGDFKAPVAIISLGGWWCSADGTNRNYFRPRAYLTIASATMRGCSTMTACAACGMITTETRRAPNSATNSFELDLGR